MYKTMGISALKRDGVRIKRPPHWALVVLAFKASTQEEAGGSL